MIDPVDIMVFLGAAFLVLGIPSTIVGLARGNMAGLFGNVSDYVRNGVLGTGAVLTVIGGYLLVLSCSWHPLS